MVSKKHSRWASFVDHFMNTASLAITVSVLALVHIVLGIYESFGEYLYDIVFVHAVCSAIKTFMGRE